MSRLGVNRVIVVPVAMLSMGLAGPTPAQARQGTIDISITVPTVDSAHVEERYALTSSPGELRLLSRPCASIGNLRVERGGMALDVAQSRDGPWITLRDTTPGDSLPLVVHYDVRLTGTANIPLVHLAAPLARSSATPMGAVSIVVMLGDASSRVVFPHMTRQAENRWSARYVGVPSFVEVAGRGRRECVEPLREKGDNGGLVWRFFLLVGIMVAWVPLYLAWARHTGEKA